MCANEKNNEKTLLPNLVFKKKYSKITPDKLEMAAKNRKGEKNDSHRCIRSWKSSRIFN